MGQILRILWSAVIFILVVTAVWVSVWFILIIVAVLGLMGVYRRYVSGRNRRDVRARPYSSGEIVDVTAEVIREKSE